MNIFNMVIPIFMHLCTCLPLQSLFPLKLQHCKPHKATHHTTKCDLIIDIKLFLTVYHRYTVANLKCYPIILCVTIASALEYVFTHISRVENSVDPDQLASQKPADLYLHCFQNRIYPGSACSVL